MPELALILFGAPRIERSTVPLHVERQKALALLTFLAVTRLPHRRDKLATLLWPDLDQEHARSALRRTLSALRQALPRPLLVTLDANIAIDWQVGLFVDAVDFRRLLAEADNAIADTRIRILEMAVQLYQDDFMSGFSLPDSPEFEEWQRTESESLRQELTAALKQLTAYYTAQHSYPNAIRYAQRWVSLDPLSEPAQQSLISLHFESGDIQGAQRQYAHYAQMMEDEIGVRLPQNLTDYFAMEASVTAPPAPQMSLRPVEVIPSSTETRPLWHPSIAKAHERMVHHIAPGQHHPSSALPLVGRNAEWQLLKRLWTNCATGKTHCVVLAGEAGIGKTRLAEELINWLTQQGYDVAAAHCYAAEGALAYSPVATWLRAAAINPAVAALDSVWMNEVARLLPELQAVHPDLPTPKPITQRWQRQRFFEALAYTFLSRKRPLLLFLDDLQWCDTDTLAWLRFLLRWDPAAPLLLLAAMRSEEVTENDPVIYFLDALDTTNQLTEIVLGRLNAEAVAEIAAEVARRPLTDAEATYVSKETEGNPLFVIETVRAGLEVPPTTPDDVDLIGLETNGGMNRALPAKVQAVIRSRLIQISQESRAVIGVAATLGREFHFNVLVRASNSTDEYIADRIDELLARRILVDRGDGRYDFSHDKLREVIYTDLSSVRRQINHRNVAVALEASARPDTLDRVSTQIAYHYDVAGEAQAAAVFYRRAASAAQHLYANADAIRFLQRSLVLLAETDENADERRMIHEALGELHHLIGSYDRARISFQRALTLATGLNHARILRQLANLARDQRHYDTAQAHYDEALATLAALPTPQDDTRQRDYWQEWIWIQLDRNMIYYWLGQVTESAALLEATGTVLEQWGTSPQQASFYQGRALMAFRCNRSLSTPEILADARAAVSARQTAGVDQEVSTAYFLLGFFLLWNGDPAAADPQIRIALRMAEQAGDISLQTRCLTYLAVANRQLKQVNTTQRYVEQALAVAAEAQMPEYVATAHANRSWLFWHAGNWQQATEDAFTALTLWQQLPATHASLPFKWTALWPLIDILRRQGDLAGAVAHLAVLAGPDQQRLPERLAAPITAILEDWRKGKGTLEQLETCVRIAQKLRFL